MQHNVTIQCTEDDGEYNLSFHVAAIFITLASSVLGIGLPISLGWFEARVTCLNISRIIYFGKFFGVGIILSTSFVHLLMEATVELQNPCLPSFFLNGFPSLSGTLAMFSAMVMHAIEWVSTEIHKSHMHSHGLGAGHSSHSSSYQRQSEIEIEEEPESPMVLSNVGVSVYLVEFAIAVHSVIIGTSLGTATVGFVPLLIAITFHQFFEGIGLGSMVIAVAENSMFINLSILIFGLTTPAGVGIGVILSSFKPNHTLSTILKGVLDSMAAGMLMYTSITLILSSFADGEFKQQTMRDKLKCFGLFYLGAALMTIFAIWA